MRSNARDVDIFTLSGVAVAAIWVSVVLASVFAPDMVSGTQHEHLAVVPITDWIWGALATAAIAVTALEASRAGGTSRAPWLGLALVVTCIWAAVAVVSIFTPVMVTGTDPTRLPLAAILAPIVAMVATRYACTFVKAALRIGPMPGEKPATVPPAPVPMATATPAPPPPIPPAAAPEESTAAARLRELARLRDAGLITSADYEAKKEELLARI